MILNVYNNLQIPSMSNVINAVFLSHSLKCINYKEACGDGVARYNMSFALRYLFAFENTSSIGFRSGLFGG